MRSSNVCLGRQQTEVSALLASPHLLSRSPVCPQPLDLVRKTIIAAIFVSYLQAICISLCA